MSTTHAVLIGIDDYKGGPNPLNGCANDIDRVQRVLTDGLGLAPDRVTRLTAPRPGTHPAYVPTAAPTRDAIVQSLRNLATDRVAPEDRVFLYCSCHGASVAVRSNSAGPDGEPLVVLREAIVPVDTHRADGAWRGLLFDFELNELLRQIVTRTRQVSAIFDCCHSAGVTREPTWHDPTDVERCFRLAGDFSLEQLGISAAAWQEATAHDGAGARDMLFELGAAVESCAVAAACLANESAMEGAVPGGKRGGYFTSALVRQWESIPPAALAELRWGRIWPQVAADVQLHEPQHPRLMASYARRVFGGPPQDGDTGFDVRSENGHYRLDVGQLAGVTEGARVAVYGSEPVVLPEPIGSPEELRARAGTLEVKSAGPASAEAVRSEDCAPSFALPPAARARVIAPGHEARLLIAIEPPDAALQAAIEARSSAFLRFAAPGQRATATLERCRDGSWAVSDDLHGTGDDPDKPDEPYLVRLPADADAPTLVRVLEHYHSYIAPVEMAARCNDLPAGRLLVNLLDCNRVTHDGHGRIVDERVDLQNPDVALLPRLVPHAPDRMYDLRVKEDLFCFEIRNAHSATLHVTLVESGSSGRVTILGGGQVAVAAGGRAVLWAGGTVGLATVVGLAEPKAVGIDRVVAIGTTAPNRTLGFLEDSMTFEQAARGAAKDLTVRDFEDAWTADCILIRGRRA